MSRASIAGRLFGATRAQAAENDTRTIAKSVGAAAGIDKAKTDALSEALIKDITTKLLALSAPLNLDMHELADVNKVIVCHMVEVAQGKPTAEKTDRWADAAMADLKMRHVSLRRVRAVISDTNAWLRREHPGVHEALKNSQGLGSHPKLVRLLTDRFLAAESEKARASRGSYIHIRKVRGEQASAKVPAGGLLAGNPSPAEGAVALRALGRSQLGDSPDAA